MPNNSIKHVYAHFIAEKSPELNNLSNGHIQLVNDKPVCEEKSAICKALTLSIYRHQTPVRNQPNGSGAQPLWVQAPELLPEEDDNPESSPTTRTKC